MVANRAYKGCSFAVSSSCFSTLAMKLLVQLAEFFGSLYVLFFKRVQRIFKNRTCESFLVPARPGEVKKLDGGFGSARRVGERRDVSWN